MKKYLRRYAFSTLLMLLSITARCDRRSGAFPGMEKIVAALREKAPHELRADRPVKNRLIGGCCKKEKVCRLHGSRIGRTGCISAISAHKFRKNGADQILPAIKYFKTGGCKERCA